MHLSGGWCLSGLLRLPVPLEGRVLDVGGHSTTGEVSYWESHFSRPSHLTRFTRVANLREKGKKSSTRDAIQPQPGFLIFNSLAQSSSPTESALDNISGRCGDIVHWPLDAIRCQSRRPGTLPFFLSSKTPVLERRTDPTSSILIFDIHHHALAALAIILRGCGLPVSAVVVAVRAATSNR